MNATMFQRLLVPLDDGELASRAIEASVNLASRLGATLTGFVVEPLVPRPSAGGAPHARNAIASVDELRHVEHAQRLLNRFEKEARRAGVPFAGDYAHAHDVADSIVQAAQRHHCDLTVMVTRDRGVLARLVSGSQTRRVLARSPLPLLVLHSMEAVQTRVDIAFKHLLVAVDGSDLGERASHAGIVLARQLGASITAFIAEPPTSATSSGYSALHCVREMQEHGVAAAEHAQGVLESFERRASAADIPFKGVCVLSPQVDMAIAEVARQQGCDMIVMVTHGRGPFGALLFGSHTQGVMARSNLPLLILH